MPLLSPTYCVDSFADLPTRALHDDYDIRGLGLDLDGSLTGHDDETVPPSHLDKLREVAEFGIRMAILSNAADDARVARVGRLTDYIKRGTGLKLPSITSRDTGHIKPHRSMFRAGAAAVDVPSRQMGYFGDQLPKDILGANWAGYGATVLCAPYGAGGNPKVVYLQRPAEALLRPWLGLPFRTANFGKSRAPLDPYGKVSDVPPGGYRRAKGLYYASAAAFALAGGIEIAGSQGSAGMVGAGVLSEALASGLVDIGGVMGRLERSERVAEGLAALGARANGSPEA